MARTWISCKFGDVWSEIGVCQWPTTGPYARPRGPRGVLIRASRSRPLQAIRFSGQTRNSAPYLVLISRLIENKRTLIWGIKGLVLNLLFIYLLISLIAVEWRAESFFFFERLFIESRNLFKYLHFIWNILIENYIISLDFKIKKF